MLPIFLHILLVFIGLLFFNAFQFSILAESFVLRGGDKEVASNNALQDDKEWGESGSDVPSTSMVDALKSIFGKIVRGSTMPQNSVQREDSRVDFGQQKNLSFNNKFKRALPGHGDEDVYELQLRIPPNLDVNATYFHRDLLQVLKNFVLFTDLHKWGQTINEDTIRIKVISFLLH